MKTKFIEGTNKQYSIREDGVIIRNYHYKGRKEYGHKIIENTIISYKDTRDRNVKSIIVRSNGRTFHFFKTTLLTKYFGFYYCPICNNKVKEIERQKRCIVCDKQSKNSKSKKWRDDNSELYKEIQINYQKNNVEKLKLMMRKKTERNIRLINKCYVASKLKISVNDLTQDLYNNYKKTLLLKREVAKILNTPVNNIK